MKSSQRTAALALFERELAFYHSDAPYLSVEKCAQRCERLSALLAAVALLQHHHDEDGSRVTD